jgi:hypothetical protein
MAKPKTVRFITYGISLALACFGVFAALIALLNFSGEDPIRTAAPSASTDQTIIERGAYLARAGNCAVCRRRRTCNPIW